MPFLVEAKSAGDATNTTKRRKEEAQKFRQLQEKYGPSTRFTRFMLYLCVKISCLGRLACGMIGMTDGNSSAAAQTGGVT